MAAEIDAPRDHAAACADGDVANVRLVPLSEAEPFVTAIYDRVARGRRQACSRVLPPGGSTGCWSIRMGSAAAAAPCSARCSRSAGSRLLVVFYRVNAAFERGSGIGHTLVVEAIGISPEATHAVWRFLFGIDWMARKCICFPSIIRCCSRPPSRAV